MILGCHHLCCYIKCPDSHGLCHFSAQLLKTICFQQSCPIHKRLGSLKLQGGWLDPRSQGHMGAGPYMHVGDKLFAHLWLVTGQAQTPRQRQQRNLSSV